MPFININQCRSFNLALSTNLIVLPDQACTEVIIYNRTGQTIEIYDSNFSSSNNAFILSNNDSFVVRGVTSSNQVSARTLTGGGTLCFRTQFFSNFTQGV